MAVVKADAYGHGLVEVARTALAAGARYLGVAQLSEALALRAAGIDAPILSWLVTPGAPLDQAVAARIELSASAPWALAAIAEAAGRAGLPAQVHLKIDTGMGRGGATARDWDELVATAAHAASTGTIEVTGIWSHLATADDPGSAAIGAQRRAFDDALASAERAGLRPRLRHLSASAGFFTAPDAAFDMVRLGLAIYGLSPIPRHATAAELGLRPAMRLESEVWLVKDVEAGTPVSYGHTYRTGEPTTLAMLPLGYADGIPRHASGTGPVLLGGRRTRIAGRVCMDQVAVDLHGLAPHVGAGDVAVLFGDGSQGEPTVQEWADAAGTISYEIVSRLGARVPRVHVGAATGQQGARP